MCIRKACHCPECKERLRQLDLLLSASTAASEPESSPGQQQQSESPDTPSVGQKIVSRLQKFTEDLEASNTLTGYGFEVLSSNGERESQTVAWY